ncbi:GDP-perosamine synthase [Usitatibacter rugosus]|uniref:GDP-perosamine synthase n=1 Tax=Usitatibacter rugosus TaxID=2732067 RepID=A0A6M4H1G3_9PROT|nr:DegT/DnrJ/EryC1/StrS family aminotransferase [Usitatibacter rugosus]QJR11707.1 GDP-perosamine synthase [Usitatibacter rugosus]
MKQEFIPVAEPDLGLLEERYVLDAVRSGWVSSIGAFIDRFEKGFAEYCGVRNAIMLSNGTVAIHLCLVSRGIGSGDEVIVPDLTFVATASAVKHAGATPVLVDVDPATYCIDPQLVEAAITPRTRAIIAVHLFGHPANMTALRDVADRHGIFLIEDAAEAHGARWEGKPVGGLGDAATFSFYGNKVLTTGEGGCITTNDDALATRVRFLKDHAMSKERRYFHPEVGFNYRMTNIQAALGCAQLERASEILSRKAQVLSWYREEFGGSSINLNPVVHPANPICWLVVALLPIGARGRVNAVCQALADEAIDTRPFFVPLSKLPPYAACRFVNQGTAVSHDLADRGICLPSSTRQSRSQVARVAEAMQRALIRTQAAPRPAASAGGV